MFAMPEGRLGRSGILLAVVALAFSACNGTEASETTLNPTSTTRDQSQRSSTTTTISRSSRSTTTTAATATTTTTAAPTGSSETSPPATGGGAVGVVGCSNTGQAVVGYSGLSKVDSLTIGDLGGGSVPHWGDPSNSDYATYWSFYDTRRPAAGYAGTWVQLCLRTGEHLGAFDADEQEWITHIVEQIHQRDSGIPVWISPINFYADGVVCESVGVDGPAIAAEASDWAAASLGRVFRGPDLGPLTQQHIGVRDTCHPNKTGESLLGSQLVAFFD
jgi:hypothetical protein